MVGVGGVTHAHPGILALPAQSLLEGISERVEEEVSLTGSALLHVFVASFQGSTG